MVGGIEVPVGFPLPSSPSMVGRPGGPPPTRLPGGCGNLAVPHGFGFFGVAAVVPVFLLFWARSQCRPWLRAHGTSSTSPVDDYPALPFHRQLSPVAKRSISKRLPRRRSVSERESSDSPENANGIAVNYEAWERWHDAGWLFSPLFSGGEILAGPPTGTVRWRMPVGFPPPPHFFRRRSPRRSPYRDCTAEDPDCWAL